MARKRYIKPGFFKNEELGELKPDIRILFIGLWCWADREGRLEDRPKRLKADIMPYDNINIDKALTILFQNDFIIRYEAKIEDKIVKIIQIKNFKEHQDVHINEQHSVLPAPCKVCANNVQEQGKHGGDTPLTYTLNSKPLTFEVDDDKTLARKKAIEEAIAECSSEVDKNSNNSFPEQTFLPDEKEKGSAQKEKELPPMAEAMEKLTNMAVWRNCVEHYGITEDDRPKLFKIFYEQKEDTYKIRYPSVSDMATNFYYWISTIKKLNKLNDLLNGNEPQQPTFANHKNTNKGRTSTKDKRAELQQLNDQSTEFLRRTAG